MNTRMIKIPLCSST